MSTPSKTPTPIKKGHITQDELLGMSASEVRLLLLASVVQDKDGKPDAEKIAKMCNFTVGSTKVLIPKAKKKLIANIDDGSIPFKSPAAKPVSAKPTKAAPDKSTAPKTPVAKRARKRKAEPKDDEEEDKFEALVRADSSEPEQQQEALEQCQDDV
ncbi:hypothetical protein N7494_008919 [Penicillium frequentans]|uniref:Uncharacterized protein n=1 Tax=Penicillium frequentans TaxID=3151616 RepID=A0AAD6GBR0_9EURO|nr:hypothetical protein N7494_008919 [Penicillium glabrum]